MKLKTIPVKTKPKEGDLKTEKKFAWWPKKVGDKLIWLECYIVVYKFVIRERIHDFRQYGIMKVTGGSWDEIEEKLIIDNKMKPLKESPTKNHIKNYIPGEIYMGPAPKPIKPWGGEPLNTSKNARS